MVLELGASTEFRFGIDSVSILCKVGERYACEAMRTDTSLTQQSSTRIVEGMRDSFFGVLHGQMDSIDFFIGRKVVIAR